MVAMASNLVARYEEDTVAKSARKEDAVEP